MGEHMNGIHLLGELYDCPPGTLEHRGQLRDLCVRSSKASGLTVVGEQFHQFQPHGVTGVVLLAESHLAIHTWPEHASATLDVFVCNLTRDNTNRAHELVRLLCAELQPGHSTFTSVHRGGEHG